MWETLISSIANVASTGIGPTNISTTAGTGEIIVDRNKTVATVGIIAAVGLIVAIVVKGRK